MTGISTCEPRGGQANPQTWRQKRQANPQTWRQKHLEPMLGARRTGKHSDGNTLSRRDSAQEIYNENVWIWGNTHKNKS